MLPCGREEKAAGDKHRDEAVEKVAEARDTGRAEKGTDNKDHLKPKRPRNDREAAPTGSGDDALSVYVAMESKRNDKEMFVEMRKAKVEELKGYASMLSNPHLPSESKVAIQEFFNGVAIELQAMSRGAGAGGAGGDAGGGAGGGFTTPVKHSAADIFEDRVLRVCLLCHRQSCYTSRRRKRKR
jgi:hypothetical protein